MNQSSRPRWLRLLPHLAIIFVLLATAEIVVRFFVPPQADSVEMTANGPLFVAKKIDGREFMVNNFHSDLEPDGIPLEPTIPNEEKTAIERRVQPVVRFTREKAPDVKRIFILGSSPVWGGIGGVSEEHSLFALYLAEAAAKRWPQRKFEFINAAHIGFGAPEVTDSLKESLLYQPDLIVIYLGGVIPLIDPGVGREDIGRSPTTVKILRVLNRSRLFQLVHRLSRGEPSPEGEPMPGGEDDLVPAFSPGSKPLSQPLAYNPKVINLIENLKKQTQDNYRRTFDEMAELAKAHGVPLLFYSVATNMADFPPLWSIHTQPIDQTDRERFADLLRQARGERDAGRLKQAADFYEQALRLGPTFADAHFEVGQVYRKLGEHEKAKAAFRQAKEFDASNERVLDRPNRLLMETATKYDIRIVDTEALLLSMPESGGYLGFELFLDHQHMQPVVLRRMADDLVGKIFDFLR